MIIYDGVGLVVMAATVAAGSNRGDSPASPPVQQRATLLARARRTARYWWWVGMDDVLGGRQRPLRSIGRVVGAPLRHQTNERNPAKGLVRRRTLIGAYRPVCCLLHRRDGSGRRPWRSWQVNLRARRVRITCDTQGGVVTKRCRRFPRARHRLGRAPGRGAPEAPKSYTQQGGTSVAFQDSVGKGACHTHVKSSLLTQPLATHQYSIYLSTGD